MDTSLDMTHRMLLLAAELGLILLAARLGGMLLEKMKLPGVMGELLAGVVLGPYALGRIALPGFDHGLFPLGASFPISPELYGFASVAAIVLLFMVGLETNTRLLRQYSIAGGLVGLGGVIVSFVMGVSAAAVLSPIFLGERLGVFSPAALFLASMATATSVGITARILSEKRQTDSPEGVTILAGAVIDDVLGVLVFTIVIGAAAGATTGGMDWSHVGLVAGKAVGIWLGATFIGFLTARRISFLLKLFGERTAIAILALGLALVMAALFEEAGLAMIIGAYVMGLTLSNTDISQVIRERLRPVYDFLTPIFFCVMGMLIDIRALGSGSVLAFGAIFTVACVAGKLFGCGLPAMLAGFNLRGAMRVGVGMIPRGEVALIIAAIGLSSGVLSAEVFAAAVLMTGITSLLAPPLLVLTLRNPAGGLRRAIPATEAEAVSIDYDFPSMETAEFLMDKLAGIFEQDAFFVHRLSNRPPLCQIRKDNIVIDFHRVGSKLTFRCRQQDLPLVRSAVLEAVAALEHAVRELSLHIEVPSVTAKAGLDRPFHSGQVVERYLLPASIKAPLAGTTEDEIIGELIELLARTGLVKNTDIALQDVQMREESMSTAIGGGLAIPHGRTEAVDQLVCAMGIKKDGVVVDSPDGLPATIFLLSLSPRDEPAPQVQFMATMSQVLTPQVRARILRCDSAEDVYQILTGGT